MDDKILILLRGLPGSGKSTVARRMTDYVHLETDKYFEDMEGEYKFNPVKLSEAHTWCQQRTANNMRLQRNIVVSNTFTQLWEKAIYEMLAEAYGYQIVVVSLFDAGLTDEQLAERCVHKVPVEKIAQMRTRWEE